MKKLPFIINTAMLLLVLSLCIYAVNAADVVQRFGMNFNGQFPIYNVTDVNSTRVFDNGTRVCTSANGLCSSTGLVNGSSASFSRINTTGNITAQGNISGGQVYDGGNRVCTASNGLCATNALLNGSSANFLRMNITENETVNGNLTVFGKIYAVAINWTTDILTEGTTNLYFTNLRAANAVQNSTIPRNGTSVSWSVENVTGNLTVQGNVSAANVYDNGNRVCTASNGLCVAGSGMTQFTVLAVGNSSVEQNNSNVSFVGINHINITHIAQANNASIVIGLNQSGVTAGTYGNATVSPKIVVDANGVVLSITNQTITTVAANGGEWTLLSTINAASIAKTGASNLAVSAAYKIVVLNLSSTNSSQDFLQLQINNDTAANYQYKYISGTTITGVTGATSLFISDIMNDGNIYAEATLAGVGTSGTAYINVNVVPTFGQGAVGTPRTYLGGNYNIPASKQVQNITIFSNAPMSGTIYVYGRN